MVMHGGLVFYGGVFTSLVFGVLYIRRSRLSIFDVLDVVSPYIALGHSIGRIGCFLNGCCYGNPIYGLSDLAIQDTPIRHPTQIYSSLFLLLLYMILRVIFRFRDFSGQVFFCYLALYTLGRFFIEFLRGDNPCFLYNLTFSQFVSVAIFILSFLLYFVRRRFRD